MNTIEKSLLVFSSGDLEIVCEIMKQVSEYYKKKGVEIFVRNIEQGFEIYAVQNQKEYL